MTSQTRRNICVATAVIVAFAAAVTVRVIFDETFAPRIFHRVLIEESRSKEKCETAANRIFVTTDLGTECVAYFVTKGFETRRQAVVFFGGDVSKQQYVTPGLLEGAPRPAEKAAAALGGQTEGSLRICFPARFAGILRQPRRAQATQRDFGHERGRRRSQSQARTG